MMRAILTHRLAVRDDLEAIKALMDAAISELQKPLECRAQRTRPAGLLAGFDDAGGGEIRAVHEYATNTRIL